MSSSFSDKFDELNLTSDELKKISDAFQKEEFRKLFAEYAEEISNPENRALYEEEIRQLEKDRGMDVKFVHPKPGYVLKTTINGTTKAFVNVCTSEHVGSPTSEKKIDANGKHGLSWSIPHLFSQPREDFAHDKKKCQVYDFVIHPHTYRMAETNPRFRSMVNGLATEGIQKMFSVAVDQKNCKQIKMKYKGQVASSVIRNKIPNAEVNKLEKDDPLSSFPYPYGDESSSEKATRLTNESQTKSLSESSKASNLIGGRGDDLAEYATPKFEMKHQSDADMQNHLTNRNLTTNSRPQRLILEVHLPLLSSASSINLDVFERSIKLTSHKPAKYRLELSLPYPVDENASAAKFDKTKHKLVVTLAVVPSECHAVATRSDAMEERDPADDAENSSEDDHSACYLDLFDETSPAEAEPREAEVGYVACPDETEKVGEEEEEEEEAETIGEIVVVHERECPKLHGILKQRSASDSSEDRSCASLERTTSADEADDDSDDCKPLSRSLPSSFGSKKSVSFSERVDRTVYQINQSVSTLHATLKNKKRKGKKKEQRQEAHKTKQDERRRRRNSGSISCESATDEPETGHQNERTGTGDSQKDVVAERGTAVENKRRPRRCSDDSGIEGSFDEIVATPDDKISEDDSTKNNPKKCGSPDETSREEDDQASPQDVPETILSWKDAAKPPRNVKCPVNFENPYIFSLDLE